jgi:hypothetical protein
MPNPKGLTPKDRSNSPWWYGDERNEPHELYIELAEICAKDMRRMQVVCRMTRTDYINKSTTTLKLRQLRDICCINMYILTGMSQYRKAQVSNEAWITL